MKAGIAKHNVTPPVGVDLTGYVARTGPSNKVHDDLFATAMVLDDGTKRIGIIAIDLVGTDMAQDAALRDAISKATGIEPRNLLIASSHTHAGPAVGVLRECGEPDEAATRRLWSQIVAAAKEANENLVEARLSYARAESDLARNRRSWVIAAKAQQSPTSGVITDREVGGLLVEMEGRPSAVIFNYACHGVVLGGDNLEISADWIGAAREALEASGSIETALFLQGCCGNINPPTHGAFDEVKRAGESVAKPLLDALATAKPIDDPKIKVAWKEVELPYMELPSEQELAQEITFRRIEIEKAQAGGASIELKVHKAHLGWAQDALKMVVEGGPESVRVGLQAISIDGVVLATLPGEPFCEYGLEFRKATKSGVMPVGYANGNIGYIPTAEAYKEGGYEVDDAIKYYAVKMIGPGSEQIIVDAMKGLLAEVE